MNRRVRVPGGAEDATNPEEQTATPPSAYPHPSTIDPEKIEVPVLTSQGWICPVPKPNNATGQK